MPRRQPKPGDDGELRPQPESLREYPVHPVDPAAVEVDDLVFVQIRGKVKEVNRSKGQEYLLVEDLALGGEFTVDGRDMIATVASADFYADTSRLSKTRMVKLLTRSYGKPLTVAFVKKDGEQRVVRGYILKVEEVYGRTLMVDLDLPKEDNLRLVDHRTLELLIVDGVRYLPS